MAFLDKIGNVAKNIGDKASETIETTKMNSKINSEKTAIAECLRQIGEIYYQKYLALSSTECTQWGTLYPTDKQRQKRTFLLSVKIV